MRQLARQRLLLILLPLLTDGVSNNYSEEEETDGHQISRPRKRTLRYQEFAAPFEGDPDCPCLIELSTLLNPIDEVGNNPNFDTYGLGCDYHDIDSAICDGACEDNSDSPLVDCAQSWCRFAWCYVDPKNCNLQKAKSAWFPESARYYSYATCNYPDVFKHDYSNLTGKTLRIGLNTNSGGWMGAYHKEGKHFDGPLDQWKGPLVELMKAAATLRQFDIELFTPPAFLVNKSTEFFQSASKLDLCIYATSLGLLDMCVGEYTISGSRGSVTDFLVLDEVQLYLVTTGINEILTPYERFHTNTATIFQSFTASTWFFTTCFMIPVMGLLMVVHELGVPGSRFPLRENVVKTCDGSQETFITERNVPISEHAGKSIYVTFLSVLQMGWGLSVVSLGAKLHMLGISFFILTLLAVYTANLAAILVKRKKNVAISSLQNAIDSNFRLCADRRHMEIVASLHGFGTESFVVDPEDGKPGFDCSDCDTRRRVFDFINTRRDESDHRYCDAAVAPLEDLLVIQAQGGHCNKTSTGVMVGSAEVGMPVFASISEQIVPLFLNLKSNGVYDSILMANRPTSVCRNTVDVLVGGETSSLGPDQLAGIWFVSFSFAFLGLLATFVQPILQRSKKKRVHTVMGRDQMGRPINMLDAGDQWVRERCVMDEEGGRLIVEKRFDLSGSRDELVRSLYRVVDKALDLSGSHDGGLRGLVRRKRSTDSSGSADPFSSSGTSSGNADCSTSSDSKQAARWARETKSSIRSHDVDTDEDFKSFYANHPALMKHRQERAQKKRRGRNTSQHQQKNSSPVSNERQLNPEPFEDEVDGSGGVVGVAVAATGVSRKSRTNTSSSSANPKKTAANAKIEHLGVVGIAPGLKMEKEKNTKTTSCSTATMVVFSDFPPTSAPGERLQGTRTNWQYSPKQGHQRHGQRKVEEKTRILSRSSLVHIRRRNAEGHKKMAERMALHRSELANGVDGGLNETFLRKRNSYDSTHGERDSV